MIFAQVFLALQEAPFIRTGKLIFVTETRSERPRQGGAKRARTGRNGSKVAEEFREATTAARAVATAFVPRPVAGCRNQAGNGRGSQGRA
jgi:hypothetical protein